MCTVADIVRTTDGTPTGDVTGGVGPQFKPLLPAAPGDLNAIQEAIDDALEDLDGGYFGSKYCRAVSYYAAHTLALAYPALAQGTSTTIAGGTGAAVTSRKAGDLALAYGSTGGGAAGDGISPSIRARVAPPRSSRSGTASNSARV